MEKAEILIKIRNYHADNHNHVNNARYLEFFEESSWDFVEKFPHAGEVYAALIKRGIIHVVVNINCNFRGGAVVGDVLRVETELARSTNRSYTWSKKVYHHHTDKLLVDGEITCVFIDTASGDVVPISEEMTAVWPELAKQKVASCQPAG